MPHIRGLRTVNCGEITEVAGVEDPLYEGQPIIVEVLRPEKHNPIYLILCYYYIDNKTGHKVEIALNRNIKTKSIGVEIYFFEDKDSIQHYTSRAYNDISKLPKKYLKIAKRLNTTVYTILLGTAFGVNYNRKADK